VPAAQRPLARLTSQGPAGNCDVNRENLVRVRLELAMLIEQAGVGQPALAILIDQAGVGRPALAFLIEKAGVGRPALAILIE